MQAENGKRRAALWKRYLLGTLLIIVATASATSVAAFREIDKVVDALKDNSLDIDDELAEADAGKPQTIMLIGSDKRPNDPRSGVPNDGPRSDTIILVRLDPSKEATALMSLPRDLKVEIPGHGTDKLNAAYSYGGPKLALKTVKQLTGLRINHVVNVDFGGFRETVNEIGCVYMDVDRRYYNPGGDYAQINVKQGYDRLCGDSALNYVRFRHTDNDLVRSARQQEFLRQVKEQYGVAKLFEDRNELFRIFGDYTQSDIRTRKEVLRLAKLVVASASQPIREVHFEAEIGESFVTASDEKVRALAAQFLGVEDTEGPRGKPGRGGSGGKGRKKPPGNGGGEDSGPSLQPAAPLGQAQARKAKRAGFPVYYPSAVTSGSTFQDDPRVYNIRTPTGGRHRAYRMVLANGDIGEYYGIQGTTWTEPPILEEKFEKITMKGRTFEVHKDGDRIRLVAWRTPSGVYWVSNTLLQTLIRKQMLGIAASTRALRSTR